MRVLLVEPNGSQTVLFVKENNRQLEELQHLVGGYIQCIPEGWGNAPNIVPKGMNFLVNEDGKKLNLAVNNRISQLVGESILGNVLVVGEPKEGKWTSFDGTSI